MDTRIPDQGLIYLRRSSSQQESSLETQLQSALERAEHLNIEIDATPVDLLRMQSEGLNTYKSIRLDDSLSGSDLDRPGLISMKADAIQNRRISHVFFFKRDRLARPVDSADMVLFERDLRRNGITLVLSDRIIPPGSPGDDTLASTLETVIAYHESGQYVKNLSERIIRNKIDIAKKGYWTGGTPPYGFGRVLVDKDGQILEELAPGRRVREPGCHVRVIPMDMEKIRIWLMILEWRHQGMGFKTIVTQLNRLEIPSPAAGRSRKKNGIAQPVSGRWNMCTVKQLCSNPIILGTRRYGVRSEGLHHRISDDGGYRKLNADDFDPEARPRLIYNDPASVISSEAGFEGLYDKQQWETIQKMSSVRSRSQKGVPKQRTPMKFPLSCLIYDLTNRCRQPMYGASRDRKPIYTCSRYLKSNGKECHHNTVDGETIFALTCSVIRHLISNCLETPDLSKQIMTHLEKGIQDYKQNHSDRHDSTRKIIASLQRQKNNLVQHMANEYDGELYSALRKEYLEVRSRLAMESRKEAPGIPAHLSTTSGRRRQVDESIAWMNKVHSAVSEGTDRKTIRQYFEQLSLRVGLWFHEVVKGTKRQVRRVQSGVIALGNTELPEQYSVDASTACSATLIVNRNPQQNRKEVHQSSSALGKSGQKEKAPNRLTDNSMPFQYHPCDETFSSTKGNRGD